MITEKIVVLTQLIGSTIPESTMQLDISSEFYGF